MANETKHTPYWHPRHPTPDGRRYSAMERKDAASLIRDHKRAGSLEISTTSYGMRVYRFYTSRDFFYESGYLQMARATGA